MNLHFSWSWGKHGCGFLKLFGGFRSAAQLHKINYGIKKNWSGTIYTQTVSKYTPNTISYVSIVPSIRSIGVGSKSVSVVVWDAGTKTWIGTLNKKNERLTTYLKIIRL